MATTKDADLILKLYELRTEATMRTARKFVAGFNPASFADLQNLAGEEEAYWRQVTSYWEMAAALVLHGALDAELFMESNGEPFFLYAKYTPFLVAYQSAMGRPFMRVFASLLERNPAMQDKYRGMLKRVEAANYKSQDR